MIRLWNRLSLIQRYTILSAAITVALAFVFSEAMLRWIERLAIEDEAKVGAEQVLRAIAPQLKPNDFGRTLSPQQRAFLDTVFRAKGGLNRAVRVRLWRVDGRLLYSSASESEAVRATGVNLSTQNGFAVFAERQGRVDQAASGLVRFFVPLTIEGETKPIAVFEIFYDLAHRLDDIRWRVRTTVPLGFFFLYVAIFALVDRGSQQLEKQKADLRTAYLGTFLSLASAIDAKDSSLGDHSSKVADLAVDLARALKLPSEMIDDVRMSARLHDLGKIGVPDAILMKAGPLNPDELVVMRNHAERGFEVLLKAPLSDRVKLAVRHSHERWDGNGYPGRLSGEQIPLLSRIVAVVDAYEAMTSDRVYRKGMPIEVALERLERDAGSHFDYRITKVFVQLVRKNATLAAPGPRAVASS
jgi:HD-GYP domain-containing protein (c-di-GMP phosphodiesterase class II)